MMKSGIFYRLTRIVAIVAFLTVGGESFAQPQFGANLNWKSKYLWRGLPFNSESVFWPDVWMNYQGLTAAVWGSIPLTNAVSPTRQITEVDYYLDYSRAFGPVSASVGYSHFTYPHTDIAATGEFNAGGTLDLQLCQVSLKGYFDVIDVNGLYVSPSLSQTILLPPIEPTWTLSIGYADAKNNLYWFGVDKAGWMDFTASLALSYSPPGPVGKWMALNGDINYSHILDNELAEAMAGDRNNFWLGLGLAFSTPSSE